MENEVKELERIEKVVREAFQALNSNLTDIAKSLRNSQKEKKEFEEKETSWTPAFGPLGKVPGPEYEVVLVKIQTLMRDLKTPSGSVFKSPCIARYSEKFGKWYLRIGNSIYEEFETENFPFRVVQWKPIPGDEITELKDEKGKVLEVYHEYK